MINLNVSNKCYKSFTPQESIIINKKNFISLILCYPSSLKITLLQSQYLDWNKKCENLHHEKKKKPKKYPTNASVEQLTIKNQYLSHWTISRFSIDTGKKEQIEAVNLELVSMRPYAGNNLQTKGQEACEVPADPYEEYFVPVNEHRKYIR